MEYIKKAEEVWKKSGKGLKKPEVLVANYTDTYFYIIRDDSYIVFMIPSNSNVTYALPKKYTKVRLNEGKKYYSIDDIKNISVVSCIGSKNDLEKLVLSELIEK